MKTTPLFLLRLAATGALLASLALPSLASDDHPSRKRAFNLPPSAELNYTVKAQLGGIALDGSSLLKFQATDGKYQTSVETRAMLLGKISTSSSEGAIDAYGLAPDTATEKRFRKSPTTVLFNREAGTITFSPAAESYSLKGGEQDRVSVTWQLVGNARAAAKKFVSGSTWQYFVAGRVDADTWNFKVGKAEKIVTTLGTVDAIKVERLLPPGSREQQLDIWLAPSLEWYPVRLRFSEPNGDLIEQTLQQIERK